jgi:hypothetical protein
MVFIKHETSRFGQADLAMRGSAGLPPALGASGSVEPHKQSRLKIGAPADFQSIN